MSPEPEEEWKEKEEAASPAPRKSEFKKFIGKLGDEFLKFGEKTKETLGKVGEMTKETLEKVNEKTFGKIGDKIEEKIEERKQFQSEVARELQKIQTENVSEEKKEVWQDLSHSSFTKAQQQRPQSPPLKASVRKTFIKQEEPTTKNIFDLFDDDMKKAFSEAQQCIEDQQESIAIQYFDYIIQLAEKKGLTEVVTFIKTKKNIY